MTLSKEKQIALLKLAVATIVVLFALWFFLIRSAQSRLDQETRAANDLAKKAATKKLVIEQAEQTKTQIKESSQKLREIEDLMVAGDVYLWIQKTLREFEIPEQLEFTKYDPPQIIESDLPLKLPYKTAVFSVAGVSAYHDLGTFLANFENSYPHIRIRRLEMEPVSADAINNNEKLSFFIEMQALVRPGNPSGSKPRS